MTCNTAGKTSAVLGFTETSRFKKQQQLPRRISIPDLAHVQGQVARCCAETCFQKLVCNNLQRPRGPSEPDLLRYSIVLKLELSTFCFYGHGSHENKDADYCKS